MHTQQSFTFRTGTPADKSRLIALGLSAYKEFETVLNAEDYTAMIRFMAADSTWNELFARAFCVVCESGDQLIGMAFLLPSGNPTRIYPADWSYIRMVGVEPAFAGLGIARQLVQMCIRHAESSGEKTVALHTSEFMHAARHLYESMGFELLREIEPVFGARCWLYGMHLDRK